MVYYNEFIRIRKELTERLDLLESELKSLPRGVLYCYNSHGIKCYSERVPVRGNVKKEKKKGVKRDPDRLSRLVRKEYVTQAISVLEKDIAAVDSLLKRYKPADENSVMHTFMEEHPELTEGVYYGLISNEEWSVRIRTADEYHSENLKSTSADGGKRRSLGELIIGGRLEYYGIPYRYEEPINHPDIPYAPDFKILRPRDGKLIYWEHLGMVNDEKYMRDNEHKFEVYKRYGIVPWDNLIVSFSQQDGGINEKLIDALIQGWLL